MDRTLRNSGLDLVINMKTHNVCLQVVLEKNVEHILHCLVLTYVEGRGYYDNVLSPNHMESWSDEEDERERHRESPGQLSSVVS